MKAARLALLFVTTINCVARFRVDDFGLSFLFLTIGPLILSSTRIYVITPAGILNWCNFSKFESRCFSQKKKGESNPYARSS